MHPYHTIITLIEKYLNQTLTEEEQQELNDWYTSFSEKDESKTSLSLWEENEENINERLKARIIHTIDEYNKDKRKKIVRKRQLTGIAATIILLLTLLGVYQYFSPNEILTKSVPATPATINTGSEIKPGGNKAILTLADGSFITLDSAEKGIIGKQENIKILKLNDGKLNYESGNTQINTNGQSLFNTITTPRGGQYQVTLSDGSRVWLNAASSITFPVAFTGNNRIVTITGEAYFEIAPDKNRPFKVETPTTTIEVLGTHFNINAYDDESFTKTTLVEGKIKLSSHQNKQQLLLQGDESKIDKAGNITIKKNVDTEEALAWMHGNFQFKSADLHSILRQISRWYDIDIEYKNNVNLHFTGQLPRSENVLAFFEKLELTGEVYFKIEGKKIIVSSDKL